MRKRIYLYKYAYQCVLSASRCKDMSIYPTQSPDVSQVSRVAYEALRAVGGRLQNIQPAFLTILNKNIASEPYSLCPIVERFQDVNQT